MRKLTKGKGLLGMLLTAVMLCALVVPAAPVLAQEEVIDQQYGESGMGTCYNIAFCSPVGQEFTPTLDNLSRVEIHGNTYEDGSIVTLNVRESTMSGPILTTATQYLEMNVGHDWMGNPCPESTWYSFDVPDISLVPGSLYVIEVVLVEGEQLSWCSDNGNPYPGGRAIKEGSIQEDRDWMFRTYGMSAPPVTSMSISPDTQTVDAGDPFTVDVVVDLGVPSLAAQFDLSFDPSLVQVDSVTEGTLYSSGGTTYFNAGAIDNTAGTVTGIGVSLLGGTPVTEAGTFATIHMTAKTSEGGTSPLTLSGVIVADASAEPIPDVVVNDGEVVVGAGEGSPPGEGEVGLVATILPAVSISVDPTSIYFGELLPGDISDPQTITITNLGAKVNVTAEASGDSLFVDGLWLDEGLWNVYAAIIDKGGDTTTDATLHVPEDYIETGSQDGMLIFWAEATP